MTLRGAITALLERRAALDPSERPVRWQVYEDTEGRHVVLTLVLDIGEQALAETEKVAAEEGADLVEYLRGCAG